MKKIVFTGGGTGGHIMPNIALIEQLNDFEIYYIGSNGMEKNILSKFKNVNFIKIPTVKFHRSLTLKNLTIPFKLLNSIKIAKKELNKINPNIIFSKGGYVSVPVCFAGNKLKIPIITHESDLSVGLANKLIAKKSKYICCSFKETAEKFGKNAIFTGSPIRPKIFKGNKNTIINKYKINLNKPIILVIGGSLGSKAINNVIWKNIEDLSKKYTIIHIVGKNNLNQNIKQRDYIQIEFAENIEDLFATCDIVITRAGSNTIFELLSICKPMILIPLPKNASRGDQIQNAKNFKSKNFANIIYQEDLNYTNLIKTIENTLENKNKHIKSMEKAKHFNGNKKLIELINKISTN